MAGWVAGHDARHRRRTGAETQEVKQMADAANAAGQVRIGAGHIFGGCRR
jgi:hypothetical protein